MKRRRDRLQHAVLRMIADTQRHAGHADIIRELIDDAAGMDAHNTSMGNEHRTEWAAYRSRLDEVAAAVDRRSRGVPGVGSASHQQLRWPTIFSWRPERD